MQPSAKEHHFLVPLHHYDPRLHFNSCKAGILAERILNNLRGSSTTICLDRRGWLRFGIVVKRPGVVKRSAVGSAFSIVSKRKKRGHVAILTCIHYA